jgi:hypothetical protein
MLSRRDFFQRLSVGLGGMALASIADRAWASQAGPVKFDVLPKQPHFSAKAKRTILLFQNGGPSHVDLFDPKPELTRRNGEKPGAGYRKERLTVADDAEIRAWLGSPFKFNQHGQSGLEVCELFPHLAQHADEISLIRSMVTDHENHEEALWNFNTGLVTPGRPSLGSWVAYGLGTENQNLPAYVAILNPKGLPVDGTRNFSNGWMPPIYQGMPVRAGETPVLNLKPRSSDDIARARLELTQQFNREHFKTRSDQLELEARIASFELAARMQLEATDALDLSKETKETQALYGMDKSETETYARQLLLARRLIERGVRFVQVLHNGQPWDTHKNNERDLRTLCHATDQPTAALLADLRQRGLLEDTLVIWGGEFGRTPMAQDKDGRDHHKHAFSLWTAGGGIKGGVTYGKTDDFGYRVVENPVTIADFHATILHLLGLDFRRVIFHHDTRDEKLTDVHEAKIVQALLSA